MTRPTRRIELQAGAYARALDQWISYQQWLTVELLKKYPDVHRTYDVRELRDQRRVLWIERQRRRFLRHWLEPEFRCLVPTTAFVSGPTAAGRSSTGSALRRGALSPFSHLPAFGGLGGERGRETGDHRLFSFLTCEPNDLVRPIHSEAMPVILADEEAWDTWLTGSVEEALELQQPCPAASLTVQPALTRAATS